MSASQERGSGGSGRFIPTLTEIIEAPAEQMDLELAPENKQDFKGPLAAQAKKPPQEALGHPAKPDAPQQHQAVRIPSYGVHVKPPVSAKASQPDSLDAFSALATHAGQVHIAVDSGAEFWEQPKERPAKQEVPKRTAKPVTTTAASGRQPGLPPSPQPSPLKKTASTAAAEAALFEGHAPMEIPPEPEPEPDIFSPLARNPGATPDALRPSDLMLVALSERIAAKARIRIEQNLEQHIQNQIFPLLDHFADQLVTHIQGDLLKIMREGIAEATREELERLSQRGK